MQRILLTSKSGKQLPSTLRKGLIFAQKKYYGSRNLQDPVIVAAAARTTAATEATIIRPGT